MTKPPYKCKCGNPTWSPILKCDTCWRRDSDLQEAQEKLMQRRYERTHFSDGTPVESLAELAPEHSTYGAICDIAPEDVEEYLGVPEDGVL